MRLVTSSPVSSTITSASTRPAPGSAKPTSACGRKDAGSSSSVRSMMCSMKLTTQMVARIGSHTRTPATM